MFECFQQFGLLFNEFFQLATAGMHFVGGHLVAGVAHFFLDFFHGVIELEKAEQPLATLPYLYKQALKDNPPFLHNYHFFWGRLLGGQLHLLHLGGWALLAAMHEPLPPGDAVEPGFQCALAPEMAVAQLPLEDDERLLEHVTTLLLGATLLPHIAQHPLHQAGVLEKMLQGPHAVALIALQGSQNLSVVLESRFHQFDV